MTQEPVAYLRVCQLFGLNLVSELTFELVYNSCIVQTCFIFL